MAQTALRRGTQEEGNSDYFTGCPIGGGFIWYGLPDKIPSNCRICDNTTLAIASFTKLHENLGGAWGVSGGNLNLPDLRGRFPRGVDGGAGNDPDRGGREAINPGGNTGDAVGTFQTDEIQSHSHVQRYGGGFNDPFNTIPRGGANSTTSISPHSTSPSGGNETRPINAAVYFVIRVS